MSKSGRPRKAEIDQVINMSGVYGVVVDYDPYREWGKYLVVRTDPLGRFPYGRTLWVHSTEFEPMDRYSRTPGVTLRANLRMERHADRGCTCQCCPHYHMPTFEVSDAELDG